jgi:hypothetical protein
MKGYRWLVLGLLLGAVIILMIGHSALGILPLYIQDDAPSEDFWVMWNALQEFGKY